MATEKQTDNRINISVIVANHYQSEGSSQHIIKSLSKLTSFITQCKSVSLIGLPRIVSAVFL